MKILRFMFSLIALPLRLRAGRRPKFNPSKPRILVIRRNRMGDMIYTLPLLHALRRHYPQAHIAVACDPTGEAIAKACPAVNDVFVLESGWTPWTAAWNNATRLQHYDWAIAAKGGFDRRLAVLTRLTNASLRIGFVRRAGKKSVCYTDPVAPPENPHDEHQIDTLLRLLKPLGVVTIIKFAINLTITVPDSSREFAAPILEQANFRSFIVVNISSTARLKFREDDFILLIRHVREYANTTVCLVAAPADQERAAKLAARINESQVVAVATPGPLDLAALLEKAICLFTPEGGAAHLAATVKTPAVVLWSEGPFKKWHSRADNHIFVHAEPKEKVVPVERVWQALKPLLPQKK